MVTITPPRRRVHVRLRPFRTMTGGSQSCGFCLQTAIDLELSIEDEEPDALQALSAGVGGLATTGGGAPMYGGSHGPPQCVVKVKARPPALPITNRRDSGGGARRESGGGGCVGGISR